MARRHPRRQTQGRLGTRTDAVLARERVGNLRYLWPPVGLSRSATPASGAAPRGPSCRRHWPDASHVGATSPPHNGCRTTFGECPDCVQLPCVVTKSASSGQVHGGLLVEKGDASVRKDGVVSHHVSHPQGVVHCAIVRCGRTSSVCTILLVDVREGDTEANTRLSPLADSGFDRGQGRPPRTHEGNQADSTGASAVTGNLGRSRPPY